MHARICINLHVTAMSWWHVGSSHEPGPSAKGPTAGVRLRDSTALKGCTLFLGGEKWISIVIIFLLIYLFTIIFSFDILFSGIIFVGFWDAPVKWSRKLFAAMIFHDFSGHNISIVLGQQPPFPFNRWTNCGVSGRSAPGTNWRISRPPCNKIRSNLLVSGDPQTCNG